MEKKNVYHGDLRPLNVIMNEEGKVFVNDHAFIHPLHDNWEKALNGHKDLFLSPQQMEELQKKADYPKYDVFKADTFSLGMTLITASLLKSTLPAYDYSSCNVNRETVYLYLQNVRQKYSEEFTEFVASMVDFNEDSRPSFVALEEGLRNLEGKHQGNQQSVNLPPAQNPVNNSRPNQLPPNTQSQLPQWQTPFTNGSKYQNLQNSGIPNAQGYLTKSNLTNNPSIPPPQQFANSQPQLQSSSASNFGSKGINMTGSRKRFQY